MVCSLSVVSSRCLFRSVKSQVACAESDRNPEAYLSFLRFDEEFGVAYGSDRLRSTAAESGAWPGFVDAFAGFSSEDSDLIFDIFKSHLPTSCHFFHLRNLFRNLARQQSGVAFLA